MSGETAAWAHTSAAQVVRLGPGVVADAGEAVSLLDRRRALLVTTARGASSEAAKAIIEALEDRLVAVFDGVRPHAPLGAVEAATAAARDAVADVVVSLGGGSSVDLAKAVCFFLDPDLVAGRPNTVFDRPVAAHVAVPTTYAGSEATAMFAVLDEAERRKVGRTVPSLVPQAVLYDPLATVGLPADVTAQTSFNALAHALEGMFSPSASPETRAVGVEGIVLLVEGLRAALADPDDVDGRTVLLTGAGLAGRCLQGGGMGVHHGLAQVLGVVTGLPHGLANAVLLPHSTRFNAPAVGGHLARVAGALGVGDVPDTLEALQGEAGVPPSLRACGVREGDLPAVAAAALSNRNVQRNIVPIDETAVMAILRAAY